MFKPKLMKEYCTTFYGPLFDHTSDVYSVRSVEQLNVQNIIINSVILLEPGFVCTICEIITFKLLCLTCWLMLIQETIYQSYAICWNQNATCYCWKKTYGSHGFVYFPAYMHCSPPCVVKPWCALSSECKNNSMFVFDLAYNKLVCAVSLRDQNWRHAQWEKLNVA